MTATPETAPPGTAPVPAGELVSFGLAMEGAHKALVALAAENEHLKSALAGDNEGVRLWMLDCGNLVAAHRERAGRAEAALARVRELAGSWAALAPADDWGETTDGTVAADCGRAVLAIIGGGLAGSPS